VVRVRRKSSDDRGFGAATMVFTLMTVVLAFSALAVAGKALSNSNDASKKVSAAAGTVVTLSEFQINPSMINVDLGGSLSVHNAGKVAHNLTVQGTSLKTSDIAPGGTETLDLSSLKAGDYTVYCAIPGHKGAGMVGMLMVGGGSTTAAAATGGVNTDANSAIDQKMAGVTKSFPAKTAGVGNQPLAPTVLPDGTKEFDLTAKVTPWEVSPGHTVQAWTYNGTVPGPMIKVNDGDNVKIVLKNELPESTVIHFHGITVPNAMDGVPDITQPPVKPGESFTYEFQAHGPELGMYHSHDHAEHQVPDGLLGVFQVGDPPVPAGINVTQQVPMVLNDAGVIGLTLNGKSFPATAPIVAKQGDWVEVNYFNEGLQIHPMHLHGLPQLVVGEDGFAVPQPYQVDTLTVAPGQRFTVLVHATEKGVWAYHCHILNHAESDNGMFGMVTAFIVQ
jgi:FtsP/CotA-like multicopper oxidase with cupredoxin domain